MRSLAQAMATVWAVGAVAARRVGDLGPPPGGIPVPLHRGLVRLTVWVETLGGVARVHPQGLAVVSVVPPRWRDRRRFLLVILVHDVPVAAALVVALWWWWPAAVGAAAAIGLLVAKVVSGERAASHVRERVDAATPSGAHHVCNFFADEAHKGAGRTLLDAVCRQADAAGQLLYLDTVAERLVAYYVEFGFQVHATEERNRGSETVLCRRMVREPKTRTDTWPSQRSSHPARPGAVPPSVTPAPPASCSCPRQPRRREVREC